MKTQLEYLETYGNNCPFCGSADIEGQAVNIVVGYASQELYCHGCNSSWEDEYSLTGFATIHDNTKNADLD